MLAPAGSQDYQIVYGVAFTKIFVRSISQSAASMKGYKVQDAKPLVGSQEQHFLEVRTLALQS